MSVLSDRVDALEATNNTLVNILNGLKGTMQGTIDAGRGPQGWSPILTVVNDGDRRVLQIDDWTGGGEGTTKPATGGYIGPGGVVATVAEAIDIRGEIGLTGPSAYQVWLDLGNTGTEQDFLDDLTNSFVAQTQANADAASAAQTAAEGARDTALGYRDQAAGYASDTSSDAAQTTLDAAATAADRVQTGQDAAATAADRVQTGQDASATSADATQTAADRVQTGEDAAAAATARTGAETAQAAAESARDDLFQKYIGSYASDGDANTSGYTISESVIYWNTTTKGLRIYDGSGWSSAVLDASGALMASNDLSDLGHVPTARANLGLGSAALSNSGDFAAAANAALTGAPTAPTPAPGTNSTRIATTAFVLAALDTIDGGGY